jgi:ATPase subunit of ABC transporter with duplicated ATPase domains
LISTANITMQFGAKPLFENISAKFGDGNRYGLIGANGCGKSTLMKILSGELAPSSGNVSITPGSKVGTLSQNQFAFEEHSVIDTVIMGDTQLWQVKQERDRIYSMPEMSEEDGMKVADLEALFAEMDGYSAESRAARCNRSLPAGSCAYYWHRRYSPTRISCCWTSQPTTSTFTPSPGSQPYSTSASRR